MGIEMARVLARLAESGGRECAALDEAAALDVLGALALVEPKRAGFEDEWQQGSRQAE
ncbi:hypothetical protein [Streptomyces sp. NPDC086787]|uniref:hypothetical protein n=1 Tax=Streptomyces sp. NPDC086787 TaxID=3365759 RepID=UPI003821E0BD